MLIFATFTTAFIRLWICANNDKKQEPKIKLKVHFQKNAIFPSLLWLSF